MAESVMDTSRFCFENIYPATIPKDCIEEHYKHMLSQTLYEFLRTTEPEKWYAIRVRVEERPLINTDFGLAEGDVYGKKVRVYLDVKETKEETDVFKTTAQIFLTPSESTRQKLKNCVKYLFRKAITVRDDYVEQEGWQ